MLIPIINEGQRIINELKRAQTAGISDYADIVICDGGSTDGCTDEKTLKNLDVNNLLVKNDSGSRALSCEWEFFGACNAATKAF